MNAITKLEDALELLKKGRYTKAKELILSALEEMRKNDRTN